MKTNSLDLQKPDLRVIGLIFLFISSLLILLEVCFHIPAVIERVFAPAPGLSYAYPEVGLKFKRYFAQKDVNCLFFGNSIVDQDMVPEIIESSLAKVDKTPSVCMNFGLSGATFESSYKLANMALDWKSLDFVVLGISPIEFDPAAKNTRSMTDQPVFSTGREFDFPRWSMQTFRLPWYYFGLLNRKDHEFLVTEAMYDASMTFNGLSISPGDRDSSLDKDRFLLHNYSMDQTAIDQLELLIEKARNQGAKLSVVEMPIKPSYMSVLIEGGEIAYETNFIAPIQEVLEKHKVPFLRTRNEIASLNESKFWRNENHLNYQGAILFSRFVAEKILEQGYR